MDHWFNNSIWGTTKFTSTIFKWRTFMWVKLTTGSGMLKSCDWYPRTLNDMCTAEISQEHVGISMQQENQKENREYKYGVCSSLMNGPFRQSQGCGYWWSPFGLGWVSVRDMAVKWPGWAGPRVVSQHYTQYMEGRIWAGHSPQRTFTV